MLTKKPFLALVVLAAFGSISEARSPRDLTLAVRDTGIATSSFVYDAKRNLIYVSSPSAATVSAVNPRTGAVVRTLAVQQPGGNLAISDDDSKLYFSFGGTIDRIDLATRQIDQTFPVDPTATTPFASAYVQSISVRPGHPDTIAVDLSKSAGLPFPAYSISVFKNGVVDKTFPGSFGVPALQTSVFSNDGNTVFSEFSDHVVGNAYTESGFTGTVTTFASPQFFPLQRNNQKLFVGPSAFNEKTGAPLGGFTVSSEAWLLAPQRHGILGVVFESGANGENATLDIVETARYHTLASFPVSGIPATFNGGVSNLTLAGTTVAFTLLNPSTFTTTLAFIDRDTSSLSQP